MLVVSDFQFFDFLRGGSRPEVEGGIEKSSSNLSSTHAWSEDRWLQKLITEEYWLKTLFKTSKNQLLC